VTIVIRNRQSSFAIVNRHSSIAIVNRNCQSQSQSSIAITNYNQSTIDTLKRQSAINKICSHQSAIRN